MLSRLSNKGDFLLTLVVQGVKTMPRITLISLLILAIGIVIGLFAGGLSGMVIGLILSGVIAIPFYCIANVIKTNTTSVQIDPFSDNPMLQKNDRSQLPKAAYELRTSDS